MKMYLSISRKYKEGNPESSNTGYFERALERGGESYGGGGETAPVWIYLIKEKR